MSMIKKKNTNVGAGGMVVKKPHPCLQRGVVLKKQERPWTSQRGSKHRVPLDYSSGQRKHFSQAPGFDYGVPGHPG